MDRKELENRAIKEMEFSKWDDCDPDGLRTDIEAFLIKHAESISDKGYEYKVLLLCTGARIFNSGSERN